MIAANPTEIRSAFESAGFAIDPLSTARRIEGRAPDERTADEFRVVAASLDGEWRVTLFVPDDLGRRPVMMRAKGTETLTNELRALARIPERAGR